MKQHPSNSPDQPQQRHLLQGFTLVEVVIAIGVLSCAILPMVGLMPHGVESLHQAIRRSAEARIQQEILGRLSTVDWDKSNNLADFDQSTWFFNGHGAPVENASNALYTVRLEVGDSTLPGAITSSYYLRTTVMKITDLPPAANPFDDPGKFRRYVATVVKMDK